MSKIEISNITKKYGRKTALNNVSLTIESGRIYGLLGRNGSGKTTMMSLISNRIFAAEGEIRLDGEILTENDKLLKKVYCMGADDLIPTYMKVSEILDGTKIFYPNFNLEYAERLLKDFEIPKNKKLSKLSTGYRTIAKFIFALSSGAEFILLDEPTLGLDANHREMFYKAVLERFSETGAAIVISTHLIDECAGLFERCFVLRLGKLAADEECEAMRRKAYCVTGRTEEAERYAEGKNVISRDVMSGFTTLCINGSPENVPDTLDVSQPTLQQLLIAMTGRYGA